MSLSLHHGATSVPTRYSRSLGVDDLELRPVEKYPHYMLVVGVLLSVLRIENEPLQRGNYLYKLPIIPHQVIQLIAPESVLVVNKAMAYPPPAGHQLLY